MVEVIKPEFGKWLGPWIFFQQKKKAYNFKANMFCFEWTMSCAPNVVRACFWLFRFKRIVNTQVSWVFVLPVAWCLLPCYNAKKTKTLTVTFQQNQTRTFDSMKCKLFQVSCFLWLTNEDALKMQEKSLERTPYLQMLQNIFVFLKENVDYFISNFSLVNCIHWKNLQAQ